MPTLPYAPPDPRSRRRRIIRWGLMLAGLAVLVAVSLPIWEAAKQRYDRWAMQRALAACLTYQFPEGVAAYAEGDAAVATLRASDHAGSYLISESPQHVALWQDTPWLTLTRTRAARLGEAGLARISAVVFLGEMRSPSRQRRLVVLSIADGGMTATIIDPTLPTPKQIHEQWWRIMRHHDRPLRIGPGRVDPANVSAAVIPVGFGTTDGTAMLRLTDADTLEFSCTIGWAESVFQKWWLDTPEQELMTLWAEPESIPLVNLADNGAITFAPDNRTVEVSPSEWRVRDNRARTIRHRFVWPQGFNDAGVPQWLPGGNVIAAATGDCVYLWDLQPPEIVYQLPVPVPSRYRLALTLSPDGRSIIVSAVGHTQAWTWDLEQVLPDRVASDGAADQ